MPRGSKESYSPKQRRMAGHIEDSERKAGRPSKKAEEIAWATVNKRTGGAKKKASSGSGGRSKTARSSSGRSSTGRSASSRASSSSRRSRTLH